MPSPTPSDVHVDKMLTNISVAYAQSRENYVADKVFPMVPVAKQSDRYFLYSKGDLLRDDAKERAPGTESAGSGVSIDNTPSYYCPVVSYHEDVSDQLRANADIPLNPFRDSAENTMEKLLIKKERTWAAAFFAASIWDSDWTGKASSPSTNEFLQWDVANSDPLTDAAAAKEVVRALTGYEPNTMVVGPEVYSILKNHSAVTDRIKYTQKGIVTADLLAGLFEVEKFLVAKAIYNSAIEGAADSVANIYGKHCLLAYAAPNPSIRRPSGGYTFQWNGLVGSGEMGIRTKRFRMEHLESDRVEGEMAFAQKLVCADMGIFLADAIG